MRELLEKILALPRRIEPLGGQNYSYVCLEDVTGLIEAELAKIEPVAWIFPSDLNDLISLETYKIVYSVEVGSQTEKSVPLYTHPPAQQKPLSDDEIKQLWEESLLNTNSFVLKFARAIEKAHGIK